VIDVEEYEFTVSGEAFFARWQSIDAAVLLRVEFGGRRLVRILTRPDKC